MVCSWIPRTGCEMVTSICRTLFFGILIANDLSPAASRHEFPRVLNRVKKSASILDKLLIPDSGSKKPSQYDTNNYRRSGKIYIIAIEQESPLIKKLEKLPLNNIYHKNVLTNTYESSETNNLETLQYQKLYNENSRVKPRFKSTEAKDLDRLKLEILYDENVGLQSKLKAIGTKNVEILNSENVLDKIEKLKRKEESSQTLPLHKFYDENGRFKPRYESPETNNVETLQLENIYDGNVKPRETFVSLETKWPSQKLYDQQFKAKTKLEPSETKNLDKMLLELYNQDEPKATYESPEDNTLNKLFDDNGMLFLTKPKKNRAKKMLRQSEPGMMEEVQKTIEKPQMVYNFSDLVV